jgi:hypothetical protein
LLEVAEPRLHDGELVEPVAMAGFAGQPQPAFRPVDAVGVRVGPVERPVDLHLFKHEGRIHPVAVDERPLLQVGHDHVEHSPRKPLVGE